MALKYQFSLALYSREDDCKNNTEISLFKQAVNIPRFKANRSEKDIQSIRQEGVIKKEVLLVIQVFQCFNYFYEEARGKMWFCLSADEKSTFHIILLTI